MFITCMEAEPQYLLNGSLYPEVSYCLETYIYSYFEIYILWQ